MATKIYQPTRPKHNVLRMFARDAVAALENNFVTQHVWPTEIYPGYAAVNAKRKRQGGWYATGAGARSFGYKVNSAADGNETITISFNRYLRFVDMGIVAGQKYDDVERDRKARHNRRYVRFWESRQGETHRPAIMMEMRHLEHRMIGYLEDYYGQQVLTTIYQTFEGINIPLNF